jgi:hypothetical protein
MWVNDTGGDPLEGAADAVLEMIAGTSNGEFHWIANPLQPAIPSWPSSPMTPPWNIRAAEGGADGN